MERKVKKSRCHRDFSGFCLRFGGWGGSIYRGITIIRWYADYWVLLSFCDSFPFGCINIVNKMPLLYSNYQKNGIFWCFGCFGNFNRPHRYALIGAHIIMFFHFYERLYAQSRFGLRDCEQTPLEKRLILLNICVSWGKPLGSHWTREYSRTFCRRTWKERALTIFCDESGDRPRPRPLFPFYGAINKTHE